ncbi:hypothetical protein HK405_000396, partial [Cladochytrium tenue]
MFSHRSRFIPYSSLSFQLCATDSTAVISMLRLIGKVENVQLFLSLVKRKQTIVAGPDGTLLAAPQDAAGARGGTARAQPTRLLGFGHRIYKTHDPRVKICKDVAFELFEMFGKDDIAELALALEEATMADEWFTRRSLYPNIDFWSAIVFHTMGFPADMFPVLMAVPRAAGYIAHWQESLDDAEYKIFRPRQVYVGEARREMPKADEAGAAEAAAAAAESKAKSPAPALDQLTEKSLPSAAKKRMSAMTPAAASDAARLLEFAALIEETQRSIDELSAAEGGGNGAAGDSAAAAAASSRLAIGPVSSWV